MPSNEFHVKLLGLTGAEIAAYAEFQKDCPDCGAPNGRKCRKQADGSVCKGRFVKGLKMLEKQAENAVRKQFEDLAFFTRNAE